MRSTLRKAIVVTALAFTAALAVPTTASAAPIVPCDSDFDCFEKNPDIQSGYTDKFRGPEYRDFVFIDGRFTHIEEDHPLWDCTTMGNLTCGEYDWISGEWFNNHFDANGEYLYSTPQNRKGY